MRVPIEAAQWPIWLAREEKARAKAEWARSQRAEELEVSLQEEFLEAIRVYAPVVLDDLGGVPDRVWHHVRQPAAHPWALAMVVSLRRWADRWRLDAPWAVSLGAATLMHWYSCEDDVGQALDRQRARLAREWALSRDPLTSERHPATRPRPGKGAVMRTAPRLARALVRFQVLNEPWHEVARSKVDRDLLRQFADAIELRLRPTWRGRPPTP